MSKTLDAKHISSYIRGMNKLPLKTRVAILAMLVEGSSMRSISRITGVSINTVTKLLVDAGEACAGYHDETVRNVTAARVQADEIWSFCYATICAPVSRTASSSPRTDTRLTLRRSKARSARTWIMRCW